MVTNSCALGVAVWASTAGADKKPKVEIVTKRKRCMFIPDQRAVFQRTGVALSARAGKGVFAQKPLAASQGSFVAEASKN